MNKKQIRRAVMSRDTLLAIRTRIRQLASECGVNVDEVARSPGTIFAGQAVASVVWSVLGYGKELVNDFDVFRCSILGGKYDKGIETELVSGASIAIRYDDWVARSTILYRVNSSVKSGKINFIDISMVKDYGLASTAALARMFTRNIVDMFDINSTMVAYSPYLDELYIHDSFIEFLASRDIKIVNARTLGRSYARAIKKSMEIPWASLDTESLGKAVRALRYAAAELFAKIGTALRNEAMPSRYVMQTSDWFAKQHGLKTSTDVIQNGERYIAASPVTHWDFVSSAKKARDAAQWLVRNNAITHRQLPVYGNEILYIPIKSRFDEQWKHDAFSYRTGYRDIDRYFRIYDAAMRKRLALRELPPALVSADRMDFFDYFHAIDAVRAASAKKLRELDDILEKAFAMMKEWTADQRMGDSVLMSALAATQARHILTGRYNEDIRTLIGLLDRYGDHRVLSRAIIDSALNVHDARVVYAKIHEAVKRHGKMIIGIVESRKYCGIVDILHSQDWEERIDKEVAMEKKLMTTPLKSSRFEYEDDRIWMVELVTPEELEREGKRMQHCVGGYSEMVRTLRSAIFACRHKEMSIRFTMEVQLRNGKYKMIQARGKRNANIQKEVWMEFFEKIVKCGAELKEIERIDSLELFDV